MTPSWERVKPIVADAMELPTGERAAYLDRSCGNDAALRAEVESLLAAATSGDDSVPGARAAIARAADDALTHADDLAGDTALRSILETALGQQYEILRALGRGGMGAVYLARDTELERLVAIKVLRPDLAALEEGRERFRREARIIARLSHPGILPLYTFGEVQGTLYLVMGYVPGVTLAERLRVEGRLSPNDAARILGELADALACAHREGVIHRDIKPANILLDDATGHAILADFGIAKIEGGGEAITSTGMVLGTPDYMSPEQLLGHSTVDERSDIYSLGAVGYAMFAGQPPFAAAESRDMTLARVSREAPPLEVPASPELRRVIMRCLARDPSLRWPSAGALGHALDGVRFDGRRPPESVRDLPAFGAYAALWAVVWIALSLTLRPSGDRALLLIVAMLVPLGLVLHVGNKGRLGLGPLQVARIAFWPPEWWGMWWPKLLRRPGDVWLRLPRPARLVRNALSLFTVTLPTVVLARGPISLWTPSAFRDVVAQSFDVIEVALVAAAGATTVAGLVWARRRRLSWNDRVRLLFGPTASSPDWESPRLAELLHAGTTSVRDPLPDSPSDHVRAISELARTLPHSTESMRLAVQIAHRLADAIKQCEKQEASVAREASSDETERLSSRIAALESSSHPPGSDEAEMLTLMRRQLELVGAMRMRVVLVSQRRARLIALLRALWTRVRAADNDRIDALRTEIEAVLSSA